jgi:hypothetical protein
MRTPQRAEIKANESTRKLQSPATVVRLFACALGFPLLAFGSESISDYVRIEPGHAPLAGAVVVVRWQESSFHGEGACRWIVSVITDDQGRYKIEEPGLSLSDRLFVSVDVYPYKSGYVFSPVTGKTTTALRMVSAGESIEDRLNGIKQAWWHSRCGRVPIPQAAKLLPFYRSLLNEALGVATDSRNSRLPQLICTTIAEVGQNSKADVEAAMPFVPGFGDPQEKLIYARVEPRCLAIMEPARPAPPRKVVHPSPSATGNSAAPSAIPAK